MDRPAPPLLSFGLANAGAALLIIQSLALDWLLSHVDSAGPAFQFFARLSAWSFLFGVVLLVVAAAVYVYPDHHVGLGLLMVVVSLFSLFVGGGFVLGAILGVLGGGSAILYEPEGEDLPIPPRLPALEEVPVGGIRPPRARESGAPALWRPCPHCGKEIPSLDRYCRHCSVPLEPD